MVVNLKDAKDLIVKALRADSVTALPHYHMMKGCQTCALADDIEAGRFAVMPTQAGRFVRKQDDIYIECPVSDASAFVPIADGALAIGYESLLRENAALREVAKAAKKYAAVVNYVDFHEALDHLEAAGVKL